MTTDERTRVLLAVSETTPIRELWRAVVSRRGGAREVVAIVISDDRWRRAASLPFTREVPGLGGTSADVTRKRADELHREAVHRLRSRMTALAEESGVSLAFEKLSQRDEQRLSELASGERSILFASALITREPICAHIARLGWHIELVETAESDDKDR